MRPILSVILFGCAYATLGHDGANTGGTKIVYEAIPGSFAQTEPDADPKLIGPTPPRFGLVDSSPNRWRNFTETIERLNRDSPSNVRYKVFYLERHGESVYNLGEAYYGARAWRRHWSLLYGNGTTIWGPDPELTDLGVTQALMPNALWKAERPQVQAEYLLSTTYSHQEQAAFYQPPMEVGVPIPQRLYTSPLSRAVHTMNLTYGDVAMTHTRPVITEGFRKVIGMHTPELRRTRSYLAAVFPVFDFEPGFTEKDELWKPDVRETREEVDVRVKKTYDRIFEETWDSNENYIAITTHGSIVTSSLRALNHRQYKLPTGGVLPVLVKATRC